MIELARGLGDLRRGFGFLNAHPALWRWVLAPAAVTLLLLAGAIAAVAWLARPLVAEVTSWLPEFLQGVGSWLVWLVAVAGLGLGALLVFVTVSGMVAGPFCELLSEAIEERVTGRAGPPSSLGDVLGGTAKGLGHSLRRLLATLAYAAALFAAGLVPVIGTATAVVLGVWLAAGAAAYDAYDAVLSRRALSYADKLAYLARRRGRALGLGAGIAGLLMIPGVNLVALGVGAAGATLAALESAEPAGEPVRRSR